MKPSTSARRMRRKLPESRRDSRRRAAVRRGRDPSRLRLPVGKRRIRRAGRGGRPDLRRPGLAGDRHDGRQGPRPRNARRANVPTVPGSDGVVQSLDEARDVAARIGYPIMIKAAAGGGRGIRVAHDAAQLDAELPLAQREAQAAFGDGGVPRTLHRAGAPHRGAGARRRPPRRPSVRARMLAAAAPPENPRGSAVAFAHARAARRCARRHAPRGRSRLSQRGRSNTCSTTRAASSTSSR